MDRFAVHVITATFEYYLIDCLSLAFYLPLFSSLYLPIHLHSERFPASLALSFSSCNNLCLDKFLFNTSNFFISSWALKLPLDKLSYISSYFPVERGAFPFILFLISNIPFLQSINALKLATHNSGSSFFNFGSVRQSFGVFLSIRTQGDLCKQMAKAFF